MARKEKLYDFENVINWKSPGKVAEAFTEDIFTKAPFITGPVGAGKSVAADVVKPLMKATCQIPGVNGERHYKITTFRNTLRGAYESTIPTFFNWVPIGIGKFLGSQDRPAEFKFRAAHPVDGGIINITMKWQGMPDNIETLESKLKGSENTDMNFAEADQLPQWGFEYCIGRIGRFPSGINGKPMRPQLWGSFNPTDFDNWLYDLLVENPREIAKLYKQPSALLNAMAPFELNPLAENLHGLPNPEDYYISQAKLARPGYIRRNLMAEFGPIEADGFAVYPEFVMQDHCVDFEVRDDWIYMGFDGGGTPAATFLQYGPHNQIDTIDEVVIFDPLDEKKKKLKTGVGPTEFGEACLRVLARYPGLRIKVGYGDPAAWFKGGADYSFAERLAKVLDTRIEPAPAPNNNIVIREEANRIYFGKRGPGGMAMRRIHPRAKTVLRGMKGEFQYESQMRAGIIMPSDKRARVKNAVSHACEADEYGICGMTGGGQILRLPPRHDFSERAKPLKYKSSGIKW